MVHSISSPSAHLSDPLTRAILDDLAAATAPGLIVGGTVSLKLCDKFQYRDFVDLVWVPGNILSDSGASPDSDTTTVLDEDLNRLAKAEDLARELQRELSGKEHYEGESKSAERREIQKMLDEEARRIEELLSGVQFRVIPMALLGLYNFQTRTITLFSRMIRLYANRLAEELPDMDNVQEKLTRIVNIHEAAHAFTHLALDPHGDIWNEPCPASVALHEGLSGFLRGISSRISRT